MIKILLNFSIWVFFLQIQNHHCAQLLPYYILSLVQFRMKTENAYLSITTTMLQ